MAGATGTPVAQKTRHPVVKGALVGMLVGFGYAVAGLVLTFLDNGVGNGEGLYDDVTSVWDVVRETGLGLALYAVFVLPLGAALGALVGGLSHRRSRRG